MSTSYDAAAGPKKGPIHVLMTPPALSNQQQLLVDPRFQGDFVAKRAKVYRRSFQSTNSKRGLKSVWDGVSRVEKDMVCCCESISHNNDDDEGDDLDLSREGALSKEKEILFAGILARDCHTMATKCLALAILERTMETYLAEEQENDSESEDDEVEESEDEKLPSDDAERSDLEIGSKRQRSRAGELEKKPKRQKVDEGYKADENVDEEEEEEMEPGRLQRFLAAGGLKVLNQWLIEASTEEIVVPVKQQPGNRKVPEKRKRKPPPTRPLILPMLQFLEHIPFDKKIVLEAKINKQIRKLGKQVNGILRARESNTAEPAELGNWSSGPTRDEKDALDQVAQAVKNLKKSWERMAKEDPRKFEDPFDSLKAKMKERLDILVQFEGGLIPKPDWFDDSEAEKERRKPLKSKKSSTKELAAKERQSEREDLKRKLQAAQNEHRERLAQLRLKFQKRKEDVTPAATLKKGGSRKKVEWKDGLKSQVNRNRKMLEEVFIFEKNTPAAKDVIVEDESDMSML